MPMSLDNQFDTLTEAIAALRTRGYILDFNIMENALHCSERNITLNPDSFQVVEFHRFEGNSDPGDMSIVYAIEGGDKQEYKGILVNGFGTYANTASEVMMRKLAVH
jgi:hypothetical protein